MNVHNREWLRYSSGTCPSGRSLREYCTEHALTQKIHEPTHSRGKLLDLVLTDLADMCATKVLTPIADHNVIQVVVDVQTLIGIEVSRTV